MATLSTAVSKAISTSLLSRLPEEVASEFNLDQADVKKFLQDYLTKNLGKKSRGSKTPRDPSKPSRTSGYMMFSNENRPAVREDLAAQGTKVTVPTMGKELGARWKALSEEQRTRFNNRATAQNESNGFSSPARKTPTPTATKATGVKVAKNATAGKWVVAGTDWVVASQKNHQIVGKLRGTKVARLTPADVAACQKKGWAVKESETAEAAPRRRKATKPQPEEDNESSDEDSE